MNSKKNKKYRKRKLSVLMCLFVLGVCTACSGNKGSNETADKKEESENPATVKEKVEEPEKQSEPVLMQPEEEPMEEPEVDEVQEKEEQETEKQIKEDPEHQVEELLDSLSVEEKVAQLFVVLPEQLVGNVSRVTAASNVLESIMSFSELEMLAVSRQPGRRPERRSITDRLVESFISNPIWFLLSRQKQCCRMFSNTVWIV